MQYREKITEKEPTISLAEQKQPGIMQREDQSRWPGADEEQVS